MLVGLVASMILPSATIANACTRQPCHGACRLTGGDLEVDPETLTVTGEPVGFECYY